MGSGISIRANVDSPTMPGKKHVISSALDDCGGRDAIFDQLLQIARDPATDPYQKYIRRKLEYEEREPGCFSLKVHKDGRKMRGLKLQDNSQDPPVECRVCRYNRERGTIAIEYSNSDGDMKGIQCFLFLDSPLRLEFWVDNGGEHRGDETVAAVLRYEWLNSVVERLAKVPVSVQDGVPSPAGDGLESAMSDPLDAFFTYDKLLTELVEELRTPPDGFFMVTSKDIVNASGSCFEQVLNNGETQISLVHRFDAEKGTASVQAKHGGFVLLQTNYVAHRDPLRLECWMEYESGRVRLGSRCAGNELQALVIRLLARVQRTCQLL